MREQFIDWFPDFDEYELIYIVASYFLCRMNNANRYRVIPSDKFEELYARYRSPFDDKSLRRWDKIEVYRNEDNNGFKFLNEYGKGVK